MSKYRIVRFYFNGAREVQEANLTLEEAEERCNDPESSSRTATSGDATNHTNAHGPWFDGYEEQAHASYYGTVAPRRESLLERGLREYTRKD